MATLPGNIHNGEIEQGDEEEGREEDEVEKKERSRQIITIIILSTTSVSLQ